MINRDFGRLTSEKIDELLGSNILREIRKMDEAKASILGVRDDATSLAAFAKSATMGGVLETAKAGLDQLDLKAVVQASETYDRFRKIEQAKLNRLMNPLPTLRQAMLAEMSKTTLRGALGEDLTVQGGLKKWMALDATLGIFKKAEEARALSASAGMERLLADTDLSFGLDRVMKNFAATNNAWVVPSALVDALGPLQLLQEKFGRLSFPVMDAASARTLAHLIGQDGILDHLTDFGIDTKVITSRKPAQEGLEANRGMRKGACKELALGALLGFLISLAFFVVQEYRSAQSQKKTNETLAELREAAIEQKVALERLQQTLAAFAPLIEKALQAEAKRQEERFVVLDRMASVRVQPEHGAAVEGKLFPREVVRPLDENGKWIEVEYYHWLHREYRTGWALKKYFERVPGNRVNASP
jgi:hypothetical protein